MCSYIDNCKLNMNSNCCKYILCKNYKKREYHKNYYRQKLKVRKDEDYIREFLKVISHDGKFLTTKGFDEVSQISSMAVIKGLKTTWKKLLAKYNKLSHLFDYVLGEYMKDAYKRGRANSTAFIKEHPYMGQYIFSDIIDIKVLRKAGGFINEYYNGQYNDYLLKKHFKEVLDLLGRIPTVTEFIEHGNILPSIYCNYYGIKGQLWDEILRIMINDEIKLQQFFGKRLGMYKESAIVLKEYKNATLIPESKLEKEFRRVFDFYLKKFGTHPTRRMFNRDSIYNDMTYRKRFKLKWSEVIKKYNYELKERNISEKVFLEKLRFILNCEYERGKTWVWLLGVRGKHLYCDGYFEQLNLVVELDGKHHRTPVPNFGGYERFLRDKQNDTIKETLVKERGYKFLRVSTKEDWENIDYIKKRLYEIGIYV